MRYEWERSGHSKCLINTTAAPFPLLVLLCPFPGSLPTCAQWAFSCGQKSTACPSPNAAWTPGANSLALSFPRSLALFSVQQHCLV